MPRTAMLSIRMPDETREQLETTAEAHRETRSALIQRYIEARFTEALETDNVFVSSDVVDYEIRRYLVLKDWAADSG